MSGANDHGGARRLDVAPAIDAMLAESRPPRRFTLTLGEAGDGLTLRAPDWDDADWLVLIGLGPTELDWVDTADAPSDLDLEGLLARAERQLELAEGAGAFLVFEGEGVAAGGAGEPLYTLCRSARLERLLATLRARQRELLAPRGPGHPSSPSAESFGNTSLAETDGRAPGQGGAA